MKQNYWILLVLLTMSFVYAAKPYEPEFSLSQKTLQEPPMLPQNYGIEIPDVWQYYAPPANIEAKNFFLPDSPMLMEICAITGKTRYSYSTSSELMQGCYRNDEGLSLLTLQPYQYWSMLNQLKGIGLIPNDLSDRKFPVAIINYRDIQNNRILMNIEIGSLLSPVDYIAINSRFFQYNDEVRQVFYSLIATIQAEAYLPEKQFHYSSFLY